MTGANAKIKRIYVGDKQVRPYRFEYEYDFRNKTASQITADGWTYDNTPSFNSDGMYYYTWASRNYKTFNYDISSAKNIVLKANFKINAGSDYALGVGIVKGSSGVVNNTGMYFDAYPNQQVTIAGTTVKSYTESKSSGTYIETMEYDLINKTYKYSGFIESSGSLTDSQISSIKDTNGFRIAVGRPGMFFSSIELTVK